MAWQQCPLRLALPTFLAPNNTSCDAFAINAFGTGQNCDPSGVNPVKNVVRRPLVDPQEGPASREIWHRI